MTSELSLCANEVYRFDRDRFLCLLFAPADRREQLFTLFAFNQEISKIRASVSEPQLGRIRLQWWRDLIDEAYEGSNTEDRGGIAGALVTLIKTEKPPKEMLHRILNGREFDMEDRAPDDLNALELYARATSGTLNELAYVLLGGKDHATGTAANDIGTAWALIGLARSTPFQARDGRLFLPNASFRQHGADRKALLNLKPCEKFPSVIDDILRHAQTLITQAQKTASPRKNEIAAFLIASYGKDYIKRLQKNGSNPFNPQAGHGSVRRQLKLWINATLGRF